MVVSGSKTIGIVWYSTWVLTSLGIPLPIREEVRGFLKFQAVVNICKALIPKNMNMYAYIYIYTQAHRETGQ